MSRLPISQSVEAVILLADISGFTRLMARLMSEGFVSETGIIVDGLTYDDVDPEAKNPHTILRKHESSFECGLGDGPERMSAYLNQYFGEMVSLRILDVCKKSFSHAMYSPWHGLLSL